MVETDLVLSNCGVLATVKLLRQRRTIRVGVTIRMEYVGGSLIPKDGCPMEGFFWSEVLEWVSREEECK